MNFGKAIEALKDGEKVARKGWNGKGMFIYLVLPQNIAECNLRNEAHKHVFEPTNKTRHINAHIDMKTTGGSICVGWLPSQKDMLAEDWHVLES